MNIIGQIFEEDNYECFRRLPDNRDVTVSRVGKLIASIKGKYILNPIIVNEKMEIIDGQGRFEALKSLGLPIHYIIATGANSDDCRRMNKYNTKWTTIDYARSYAKSGSVPYQLLLLTCKKTGLSISRVLRLSNHGPKTRDNMMSGYERGELTFNSNDVNIVLDVANKANDIIDALLFTARPNDAFYASVKVMTETDGYDHDRMIKNCNKLRNTYVQASQLKNQLFEMERIYNYNTKSNKKIYFSDYMRNKGYDVRNYSNTRSQYAEKDISTLKED